MAADTHHGLLADTGIWVDDFGGDGRPVVLIHGWPLSGESWSEQVQPLSDAGYRVITYDRRGFGRSERPTDTLDYDTLSADLDQVLQELDLTDVTLVGFSMGGGEVARYLSTYGPDRVHSVVFASAVPPYLLKTDDNPDGPLDEETAEEMVEQITEDREGFFDDFASDFFSVDGDLAVTEQQRLDALELIAQADLQAILDAQQAWAKTDFRDDLATVTVPTLVIHGDADATVPFEGSGERTAAAIDGSQVVVITGAPHGVNVSHPDEFNRALLEFLAA